MLVQGLTAREGRAIWQADEIIGAHDEGELPIDLGATRSAASCANRATVLAQLKASSMRLRMPWDSGGFRGRLDEAHAVKHQLSRRHSLGHRPWHCVSAQYARRPATA